MRNIGSSRVGVPVGGRRGSVLVICGCHLFRLVLFSSHVVSVLPILVVKYLEMKTFQV